MGRREEGRGRGRMERKREGEKEKKVGKKEYRVEEGGGGRGVRG